MMIGTACFTGKTRWKRRSGGVFDHPRNEIDSIVLLDDDTMETTIEVDVDELWTTTVAKRPSINPAIGFESMAPSVKSLPVILPEKRCNAQVKKTFLESNSYLPRDEKMNSSRPMNRQIYRAE
jgi:hypothetical protein